MTASTFWDRVPYDQDYLQEKLTILERMRSGDKSEDVLIANKLRGKFTKAAFILDGDEAEKITTLYSQQVAGVGDISPGSLHEAGKRLNSVGEKPPLNDARGFWEGVSEAIPVFLSEEEVSWLIENDSDCQGAFELFWAVATYCPWASSAETLLNWIHWYK